MSSDVILPSSTAPVAEIAPPAGEAPPPDLAPAVPVRIRLAAALHARGVTPDALIVFSLAFVAAAMFVLLLDHPGVGAVLGLVALGASELARVPVAGAIRDSRGLVQALLPLVDLLWVAGLLGGLASHTSGFELVLGLLVFILLAWLPLLRAVAGPHRMPAGAELWTRGDRLALLMLGALIGRIGPAFLFVAAVGLLDAWLRVERLDTPGGFRERLDHAGLRRILREDGSLVPALRWTSLFLAALALFLLPISSSWRF